MGDLYNNTTFKNHTYDDLSTAFRVTTCIIISIGLPLTLLAIYALVSLFCYSVRFYKPKAPHSANDLRLANNLNEFYCRFERQWDSPDTSPQLPTSEPPSPPTTVTTFSILDRDVNRLFKRQNPRTYARILFVDFSSAFNTIIPALLQDKLSQLSVPDSTCRYLVIACPLWYRFRRTIKFSLVVSFMVWAFSIIHIIVTYFVMDSLGEMILLSISLLLPFPLLIFFLAGTLKALSASISVPPEEKRQILGVLVLVLLNYTLLFLPTIIWVLAAATRSSDLIFDRSLRRIFIRFSPLVDLVLYVFMKKGAVDKLLACLCRCRMTREQEQGQINTMNDDTTERVSSV
ncbi:uncharacterized protein [Centroberyx affinis]|uniref:uncharacterized protein n=1 Tax=Centroberyx affinis TaxID=166261 RepID=UPI003A5BB125